VLLEVLLLLGRNKHQRLLRGLRELDVVELHWLSSNAFQEEKGFCGT
jgi:hypothetical protein